MHGSLPSRSAVVLSHTSWISQELPKRLDTGAGRTLEELDREVTSWLEENRASNKYFIISMSIIVIICVVNFSLAVGALLKLYTQ